jgi:two-component system, response regulator
LSSTTNYKYSIVIADDDADDQFLIQKAIKEVNSEYRYETVANGLQLMELLLRKGRYENAPVFKPDIILLDINMPILDGFSALEQIRSHEKLKNIPTYILSTSRSEIDVFKSNKLGANAFYSKPNQFSQLKNIIVEICENARVMIEKNPA